MSRASEIKAVLDVFRNPSYEEWCEEDAADKIRSAILAEWKGAMREAPPVVREGLAFKFPWSSTAHHVAYVDELFSSTYGSDGRRCIRKGIVWTTSNTMRYGGLLPLEWEGWSLISRSSAKSGGAGENEKGWRTGETVRYGQFGVRYNIVQTHAKCVLLRDYGGHLMAEPNDMMESFRRVKCIS